MARLNVTELKAARAILKELTKGTNFNDVISVGDSRLARFTGHEKVWYAEIAIRAIDEIEHTASILKKWELDHFYGIRHSRLSYDGQGFARALEANYGSYKFYVTTTHDMDYFGFTRAAVDELVIDLLKKVFVNYWQIESRADSCNPQSGSKFRLSHRALGYKIFYMNWAESENKTENTEPAQEITASANSEDSTEEASEMTTFKINEEAVTVEPPAEETELAEAETDVQAATTEPAEPQVYFYISGTIYGDYDSEEMRELSNYLWTVNDSGKPHNKIRIEHFEGTDVEEYCDSGDYDVSGYMVAEYIRGTVTPWTLHQIQAYDGDDGIKVDLKVDMRFAC